MLSIPPKYIVGQDFQSVYDKAKKIELWSPSDPERMLNLRCSQLPFCPTGTALRYLRYGLTRKMDMLGAYYTTVGTAVHEVMQSYLAMTGRFLADYYCTKCGRFYPLSHQYTCCDHPTEYHEVTIDYKGVVGHIDGIYMDARGRYWILDFKTCTINGATKKMESPGPMYESQVRTYSLLLKLQHGIKTSGAILCFIPRDNPNKPYLWVRALGTVDYAQIKQDLLLNRSLHRNIMKVDNVKDLIVATKHRCSNQYCEYCTLPREKVIAEAKASWAVALKEKRVLPIGDLRHHLPVRTDATMTLFSHTPHMPTIKVPAHFNLNDSLETIMETVKSSVIKARKLTRRLRCPQKFQK